MSFDTETLTLFLLLRGFPVEEESREVMSNMEKLLYKHNSYRS